MFVAAADVDFPTCDADTIVQRPPWFYHSLQLDRSFSFASGSGGTTSQSKSSELVPNPSANANHALDFQAHGVTPEYSELMLNLRILAKTYQTANDCGSAREYQDVLTFLCSTLQRLLTLPLPAHDPLLGVSGIGSYESAITTACRHALIIHVFAQWCGHQPDPTLLVSTAQHNLLLTLRPLIDQRHVSTKLLLWLLSVGGTCPYGPAQHKWFVSQLADVATDLEIHSWEDMKASLQQVIWHEYQDDKQHKELWDEVVALRDEEAMHFSEMVYPVPSMAV
ncbi:hypothetical protein A1O7_02489 [Cladophialophora yegresii CBS 114405]|uniref:Uncharacterized protein n=1 Tax=Cladophialophora yegresii CBS 114405 TaxID=1182544 RepID=W9WBV9_9EURO|nr:uncharacterized protein A1O7_02489 [Cladophialophora yegresii CBS 114405]EXJ62056.1 hypothetical protein A1O7_02489 [Cladophialophora yegresii CBS 114405]